MQITTWLRIAAWCAIALAPAATFADESSLRVGFGHDVPGPRDAAFYRSYARPEHGPIETIDAGRWRLEIDLRTRIQYPRLLSLTSGANVDRANAALEAIHGRLDRTAVDYHRELIKIPLIRDMGIEVDDVLQLSSKVAYLSQRFLAVATIGRRLTEGNASPTHVLGVGIDIGQGSVFSVAACQEARAEPFFTFGSLMTICDDAKLKKFRTLWLERAHIVQDTVAKKPDDQSCRSLVSGDIDTPVSLFSAYPTPRGLAVHSVIGAGGWEESCIRDPDSPFFPVIIPWAKLAPLMNPGPWRDELLALP